jgi:hypothetical protein
MQRGCRRDEAVLGKGTSLDDSTIKEGAIQCRHLSEETVLKREGGTSQS